MGNNNKKPTWYSELAQQPLEKAHWTEEKMNALRMKFIDDRSKTNASLRVSKFHFVSVIALIAAIAVIWNYWPMKSASEEVSWEARQAYTVDGAVLWNVFPGGELEAGQAIGALWMIHKPFDEMSGHRIQIFATHQQTGLQLVELPEITLEETNRKQFEYYFPEEETSYTRIVSDMAMPLEGKWRFEMQLDGAYFGDAIVELKGSDWELSPTFSSGSYTMTGVEKKLGIINPGFIAGQGNKYMWHFWGQEEQVTGDLIIYGINQSAGELVELFTGRLYPGSLNGADASQPSSLTLPTAGKWSLIAVINNRWFDSIVVQAE